MYQMTKEEAQTILKLAGALRAGIALQPFRAERFGNIGIPAAPDSTPTNNPSLKWDQVEEVIKTAEKVLAGLDDGGTPAKVVTLPEVMPEQFSLSLRLPPHMVNIGDTVCVPFRRTTFGAGSASLGVDGGVGFGRAQVSSEPGYLDGSASGLSGGSANVPIPDVFSLLYFNFRVEQGAPNVINGVYTISLPR